MKSFLNWFLTGFAAFFSVPTLLIIISWNALPGDRLYSLKTSLEDVALVITSRTPLASTLSVKYTQRRFSEANTLLAKKGSTIGYKLLVTETQESKKIIMDQKDTKKAEVLINKIEKYQKEIEQKQIAIKTGGVNVPVSKTSQPTTVTTTPLPIKTPTVAVLQPTPKAPPVITPAKSQEEVIKDLEKTNQELEKVKEEIKEEYRDLREEKNEEKEKNHNHENEEKGKDK
jgi:hypothetical protein